MASLFLIAIRKSLTPHTREKNRDFGNKDLEPSNAWIFQTHSRIMAGTGMFSLPGAASQINWFLPTSTSTSVSGAQSEGPSAVIGQDSFLSTLTKSQPKPAQGPRSIIELEEERLRAAHLALLEIGTHSQDHHEVTASPIFTVPVLKCSRQHFSQYGFLAGIS
jgi:hypothetical protein